jgi:hypothetical protein
MAGAVHHVHRGQSRLHATRSPSPHERLCPLRQDMSQPAPLHAHSASSAQRTSHLAPVAQVTSHDVSPAQSTSHDAPGGHANGAHLHSRQPLGQVNAHEVPRHGVHAHGSAAASFPLLASVGPPAPLVPLDPLAPLVPELCVSPLGNRPSKSRPHAGPATMHSTARPAVSARGALDAESIERSLGRQSSTGVGHRP